MARKSPWQQFSDNFSSVYGSFKELGQGIESARIMAEDPEVITMGGIKQPHQDYQATYGGKTYDKEITPEMLTGLRNQRLADVKRKYGDVQGAMDMELKSAQLIESRNKAKLDEQTFDSNVQIAANQADLGEVQVDQALVNLSQSQVEHQSYIDTLPDREKLIYAQAIGAELDNDGKTIKNYIAEATKEDAIQAVKLGVTALEIQNVNAELAGEGLTLDNEGKLISNEIASATKGLKIGREALKNAKMILENKGLYLTAEGQVLTLERSKAIHEKEKQKDAIRVENELTELKNTQEFNNAYKDFAAKAALGDKEGGFASQEEANNYLLTNLSKISPEYAVLAMELQQKYSKHEIQNINDQGTLLKSKAMKAMAEGGPDAVRKIVDEMNGINNVKVETKDGIVTMTEVTPDGKFVRTIATGKEGAEFTTNLDMALDPANMMATSKAYHDANKSEAEAAYYVAKTEAEKKGKALTKDQWAIQEITKNPDSILGYAILLGEGYDLETIQGYVKDAGIDSKHKDIDSDGSDDPDGNDESTQGGLKQQKPLKDSLMEEIAKQEKIIQNVLPTNPAHKKATERLNYIQSKAGSEELIAGIDAKLKELGPMEVVDPKAKPTNKGNNQKKTRNKLREKHMADRKALMAKLGTATKPDPSTLVSSSNMNLGLSANR